VRIVIAGAIGPPVIGEYPDLARKANVPLWAHPRRCRAPR